MKICELNRMAEMKIWTRMLINYLSKEYDIIRMPEKCKLDGGDVVFYDDYFLIGLSTRTNEEGANFLKREIRESGYDVKYIKIPESTLHLTTVCSTPRPGTMIMAEGHLNFDDFGFVEEIIKIPNSESYAANVLGYSNDRVIEGLRHKKLNWEGWMWHPERDKNFNLNLITKARKLFKVL